MTPTTSSPPDLARIAEPLRPLVVPIETLTLDPRNARKHPERNIVAVMESLKRFGQQKPVVLDAAGVVRAGNATVEAARRLGWSHVAAINGGLEGAAAAAYGIADNRTAEIAEWDLPVLTDIIVEQPEFDWLGVGFDNQELAQLLGNDILESATDPDVVPAPPDEAITKPGDLWVLGDHRLLCGDSTRGEHLVRLMADERASLIFTDPPYGVSIAAKNRMLNSLPVPRGGGNTGLRRNVTDITCDDLIANDLGKALLPAFVNFRSIVMADDCTLFVCAPQRGQLGMMMMMMMRDADLPVRHVLIWRKNQPTFSLGRLDYDYAHEPILLTWIRRHKRPMSGQHRTSVWEIDKPRQSKEHPTMKPVALYVNAYLNNSEPGDVVFDGYAGSGTALIAAEQTRRRCRAVEISPCYCDVAVVRWEKFTGQKAELAGGSIPTSAL